MAEYTPILLENDDGNIKVNGTRWIGRSGVRGPAWARMPLLTMAFFGPSGIWAVQGSYAAPYLLSLGLSKSFMSIAFLAGPTSGLVVQPLMGVFADNSKSRWGRRRPFIFGGVLVCVCATLIMGFTRSLVSIFIPTTSSLNNAFTIALVILAIYLIDFSVNAVQGADRALLVDVLPVAEQELGNAWAGIMSGLGSVVGFFIGNVDLPKIFPFLGQTQLQVFCILASLILVVTHVITGLVVTEKALVSSGTKGSVSLWKALKDIWYNTTRLPPTIRQICFIQFFSWIGWFPFLAFASIFIGDLYKKSPAGRAQTSIEAVQGEAALLTSRAFFWNSILVLACSILLPFLVCNDPTRKRWYQMHMADLWALSQALFSFFMGLTLFIDTIEMGMALVSAIGLCWAVSQYAPFSLLGEAILSESVRDDKGINMAIRNTNLVSQEFDETGRLVSDEVDRLDDDDREGYLEGGDEGSYQSPEDNISDRSGIILGIHNTFIVIPQFLTTGLSSILYAIFEPGKAALVTRGFDASTVDGTSLFNRGEDKESGINTTGLLFRIGGIGALIACIMCWRLGRTLKGK